jgi:hypothetical protein
MPEDSRVEYAVGLMVVLRCTQTLLLRLKQFDDAPDVRTTTKLGDWYGNLIRMGNRHILLFISERSRLPIMLPVREANRLRSSFPDAVCQALAAIGVPAEIVERERLEMSEIAFGRTRSRSLLGSLNDFSMMVRMHFITRPTDSLERIARDLAETPLILPFDGAHPSAVTRRILDVWMSSLVPEAAVVPYPMNRIAGHQLRNLLNISSRHELDGFLKHHGVPLEYTIEDFEREADTSARLWRKRRDEHQLPRDSG